MVAPHLRTSFKIVDDGQLNPAFVQLVGILIIVATVVYGFVTGGRVLVPFLTAGGALMGVAQYLNTVQDIKSILEVDKRKQRVQKKDVDD